MTFLSFIAALSLSVMAFELTGALSGGWMKRSRLGEAVPTPDPPPQQRSAWHALLVVLWPGRFDPQAARDMADVVGLLKRAGYPYDTAGEFYAAALRQFSLCLALGGLAAGALFSMGLPMAGLVLAGLFVVLGLRMPYARLQHMARRRAGVMRDNMLTGLALLSALVSAGLGVQEALRRTASVGGPFCNLLGLLIARMEVEDFAGAIATTRAHLPDPEDLEAGLFLRDVEDFFVRNRPLLSGLQALQESVHRSLVEATETRAGLVRQRSGLFGVLAVVGLVFSIIAPFAGVIF